MLFATDGLAGLHSATLVSRLGPVVRAYRVKIFEPAAETHAHDMTLFVNDNSYPAYEPAADEVELL